MDERLQAGRHHLLNGDRALRQGYPDDSRAHFEAALLQFRGPDLRLGEAHALRGLATVALASGDTTTAERRLREAIDGYQAVYQQLDRIDEQGVSHELRRDAQEGEGAAMVLFGDLMVRIGRIDEARSALGYAREIYGALGDVPSSAAVWHASGRLYLREGRYERAREAFEKALSVHEKAGDVTGQVDAWLQIGELRRVLKDLGGAEQAFERARPLAQQTRNPRLEGRAIAAMGSLQLQQLKLAEARASYEAALPLVRKAGDAEIEGYVLLGLGDAMSRLGDQWALDQLLDGARILASLEQQHGLATGLLRIGEHALRSGAPDVALVAGEGARRLYRRTDPVRGVGQAMRILVKALAARQAWEAVLVTAIARESIAGSIQQNARDVAAFYRKRAPAAWVEALKPLGAKGIADRSEQVVLGLVGRILARIEVPVATLDTGAGTLAAVEALSKALPRPSRPEEWERGAAAESPFGGEPADEEVAESPAEPPAPVEPKATPAPAPMRAPAPAPGPGPAPGPAPVAAAATEPTSAGTPATSPASAGTSSSDYAGLYEPLPAEEAVPEVPKALREAPPPAEYAGLYDPPESE